MTGLGFLDLVIGLVFIFFLLSLMVSSIQEVRANIRKLRSKNLEQWFHDTLKTKDLGKKLLNHKLISGLVRANRKPSYIPSENFVSALLDTINVEVNQKGPYDINTIKKAVKNTALLPDELKRFIEQSISEASGELDNVRESIATWFDGCMDRIGGTYKNRQQRWLIFISFVVVALFNADAISLTKFLYQNDEARTALATQAAVVASDSTTMALTAKYLELDSLSRIEGRVDTAYNGAIERLKTSVEDVKTINGMLRDTDLPIGWVKNTASINSFPTSFGGWVLKVIGLLVSAFAVSLGTPFWFDTLNKLVNMRGAGKKPAAKT